jgi:hypothetical protein
VAVDKLDEVPMQPSATTPRNQREFQPIIASDVNRLE